MMTTELTQLTGTDKQIEFANDLRETFLTCWLGEEDKIVNRFGDKGEPGVGAAIVAAVGPEAQTLFDGIATETSAKVWIDLMWLGSNGKGVKISNDRAAKKKNCIAILRAYKRILAGE